MIIRATTRDDARTLFDWLNAEDTRRVSLRTAGPVTWESHVAWLEGRLTDPDAALWIAEQDGLAAGQVRLQGSDSMTEVSVYVDARFRRHGLALSLLNHAVIAAARLWPSRIVAARIKPDNAASIRLFRAAGFRSQEDRGDHLLFMHSAEGRF